MKKIFFQYHNFDANMLQLDEDDFKFSRSFKAHSSDVKSLVVSDLGLLVSGGRDSNVVITDRSFVFYCFKDFFLKKIYIFEIKHLSKRFIKRLLSYFKFFSAKLTKKKLLKLWKLFLLKKIFVNINLIKFILVIVKKS